MKGLSGKKLFAGIVLVLILTLALGIASVAYAVETFNPIYVVMKYPVEDDNEIKFTNPSNCTFHSSLWGRDNKSNYTVYDEEKLYPLKGVPNTYKVIITIDIDNAKYAKPAATGWGVVLKEEETGYERKYAGRDITVTERKSGSTIIGYRVEYWVDFSPLRKAETIKHELVYGNGEEGLLDNLKDGDSPIFDVMYNSSYHAAEDKKVPVKWYAEDDTEMKKPLAYSAKLVGGQSYKMVLPIAYTKYYVHYSDGDVFNGFKLDKTTVDYYESEKYDPSKKTVYVTLNPIYVTRKVESLQVKGITAPKAGDKPVVTGITLSTPESNTLHPITFPIDAANTKWEGEFDKYGNFKSNTGYTLTIRYSIDYDSLVYDIDMTKGFALTKVSANAGTVESDVWSSTYEKTLKINYTVPKDIYQITFDANGGTGTMAKGSVEEGKTYKLPDCTFTPPAGKLFDKWDKGEVGSEIPVTENITVKALWKDKPVEYKITFAAGGGLGSMAGWTVEKDDWCVLPACEFIAPEGKIFDKWDKGAVNAKFQVTADTVVTALWKDKPPVICTVTFAANGGTGTMAPVTVNEKEWLVLPACEFTPPAGKVFDKWLQGDVGAKIVITADTTITAQWKDKPVVPCKVLFSANGGTGEMASVTVNQGDQYTLPENGFTAPEGKLFDRWDKGAVGEKIVITADTAVAAQWKDKPIENCVITFAANGGAGEMAAVTVAKGSKYTLPACAFSAPAGNEFDAWDKGAAGAQITVDTDLVITAVWKAKPVIIETWKIQFAANGGSGTMASVTVNKGEKYTLPACGFTPKAGKEFDGWDLGAPGTQVDITADTIIVAQWKAIQVTEVTAKDGIYKLSGSSATLIAPVSTTLKSLSIPDTVKANGKKYKVTAIADSACKGMSKLTSLSIGKNVKKIGANAFKDCKKLKTIKIKTTKLTSSNVKSNAFANIYSKATIKCPSSKVKTYKTVLTKRGVSKKATFKKQ